MMLHLRYHVPSRLPIGRLIKKALVPDHAFMTRSPHRVCQQLLNVPLQTIVGRDADRILQYRTLSSAS